MFWNKAALIYDFFEKNYNGKVYRWTGMAVAEEIDADDVVLECACGTGAISVFVAPVCARLIATDFSNGMLKQTAKKAKRFTNMEVAHADITKLDFPDNCFDKVIAGNQYAAAACLISSKKRIVASRFVWDASSAASRINCSSTSSEGSSMLVSL